MTTTRGRLAILEQDGEDGQEIAIPINRFFEHPLTDPDWNPASLIEWAARLERLALRLRRKAKRKLI